MRRNNICSVRIFQGNHSIREFLFHSLNINCFAITLVIIVVLLLLSNITMTLSSVHWHYYYYPYSIETLIIPTITSFSFKHSKSFPPMSIIRWIYIKESNLGNNRIVQGRTFPICRFKTYHAVLDMNHKGQCLQRKH